MVRSPRMVRTSIRVRLERTAEVGHRKAGHIVLHTKLLRSLIKSCERRTYRGQKPCLHLQLVKVCIEVADACKEDLSIHAKRRAHLDDLSDLLKLRSQSVVSGKGCLQRANRLNRIREGLRIRIPLRRNGVIGLDE